MRPGPPPTPFELRVLQGNPGHRRLPKRVLKPKPGATCPPWLSRKAKAEWDRLAPELLRLGLLTELDQAALACLCVARADLQWAEQTIKRQGHTTTAGNGTLIPHPAVTMRAQAMEQIRKFSAEFGLTPAMRQRLHLEGPEDEKNEDDKWFGPRPAPAPQGAPPRRGSRKPPA